MQLAGILYAVPYGGGLVAQGISCLLFPTILQDNSTTRRYICSGDVHNPLSKSAVLQYERLQVMDARQYLRSRTFMG